jgi:hypothetical protein
MNERRYDLLLFERQTRERAVNRLRYAGSNELATAEKELADLDNKIANMKPRVTPRGRGSVAESRLTELEEARLQLSDALLKLWDQAELVDRLFSEKMSTETATTLLAAMRNSRRIAQICTDSL